MCGITGLISDDDAPTKRRIIGRMTASIMHRGPDAWGRYVAPHIGLGNSRLAIIDLVTGDQPMNSPRSAIVCNGEIYNYLELRTELEARGAVFRTESDTEVALQAIDAWGTEAFARFNGQFALLYWDKVRNELLVARDHYGIRPLYYATAGRRTLFASEMKALDASGYVTRSWAPRSLLMHGLLWNTPGDETVFREVRSVPPGSWAAFSSEGRLVRSGYYYRLGEDPPEVPDSYEEARRELVAKLRASVELRLRSDVPVGCYLSGGIDSSVTSYLAHELKQDRFRSFSVSFEDPAYDESEYQEMMSRQLGSEHLSQMITADTIDTRFLDAARHFERPVFRTASVPLLLLAERVRESNVKVVLTGEGADEILCGYDVFKEVKLLEAWQNGASRDDVDRALRRLYPHLDHYSDAGNAGFLRMYYEGFLGRIGGPSAGLAMRIHNNRVLERYLNRDWDVAISNEDLDARLLQELPPYVLDWPVIKRSQYLEIRTLLEGYLLSSQGDRMAMAHGVEGRYPFLDPHLVEWALNLPAEWKLAGYDQKHILKDAFRQFIPEAIINRPKRPYMAPDLEAFIRNGEPTERTLRFLDPRAIAEYGIFDSKMVERLLFRYKRRGGEGIGYRDNMLVSFLLSTQMIEYWIRNPEPAGLDDRLRTVDVQECA
jgi:asparagine synthase (glutamine-hydrolysing)